VRVVFQYFGVNSALAAAAAQAKCAPALVKPGAEVREYSDWVQAKTAGRVRGRRLHGWACQRICLVL